MHSCISDVADFRTVMGLPIAREPDTAPTCERLNLIASLLDEEHRETIRGINHMWLCSKYDRGSEEDRREALAEVADGLADLIYVAVGAALELGIPLAAVWAEVHRSNMAKVRPPIRVREDGKILKPEGWTPPDVLGAVFGKGER